MLYYKLPFYGKRGSIGEIKELETRFEVLVYNIDGKQPVDIITVRNTPFNRGALLKNFFKDVEEYLDKNRDNFFEFKNKKKKIALNKNMAKIILIISILVGIGIPFALVVFESVNLGNLGLISMVIGASFSTASIISLKNEKENEKMEEFLKEYSNLHHELKIYNEDMTKNSERINVRSRSLSPSSYDKDKKSALVKTRKQ